MELLAGLTVAALGLLLIPLIFIALALQETAKAIAAIAFELRLHRQFHGVRERCPHPLFPSLREISERGPQDTGGKGST